MKKLLLLLLFVTFIFSCAEENKKINELEEEIENLNDRIDELNKEDNKRNLYEFGDLNMDDLEEEDIYIRRPEPPPKEETPPEVPEEIEIKENKEKLENQLEVTEQEKAFDKNNDGKIDIEEQKKLNEFLEKIGGIGGKDEEEYNGGGEEGKGKGIGEGKGFGDGLDSVGSHNSIDPATLDCKQGKGTGGLTIKIIRSPYGKIVEFDQTSFESKLTGITFSSDQQKERLLDCIKKEYNEAIDKGEKVKIYEKDHLHTLKLDFIN